MGHFTVAYSVHSFSTYLKLFVAMGLTWSVEVLAWFLSSDDAPAPQAVIIVLNMLNICQVRNTRESEKLRAREKQRETEKLRMREKQRESETRRMRKIMRESEKLRKREKQRETQAIK